MPSLEPLTSNGPLGCHAIAAMGEPKVSQAWALVEVLLLLPPPLPPPLVLAPLPPPPVLAPMPPPLAPPPLAELEPVEPPPQEQHATEAVNVA
tara:strand:+ start:465 stop:743 length:279 start_codon:yes stop_codon:yes gene_type:complete